MAFRGSEMMKKLGEKNLKPALKESLKKHIPDSKVVMNRAKRGLFAGKHIRFGNRVSEDGGNKSRRSWKPNVQEKRLFSYILDRHIRVKVTVHALRCIDKAGGIDEYLLKTPYQKMDTETGLFWKAKIEKLYEELGSTEAIFFSPEDEAKFAEEFKEMKLADRAACSEAQRLLLASADKPKQSPGENFGDEVAADSSAATTEGVSSDDKYQPYPGKRAIIFNF